MPDISPAETAPIVHVYAPSQFLHRAIRQCPTCGVRRRFAGYEAVWYGTTWTCCACGDSWSDGERHERPFRRGWRKVEMARARRLWDEASAFKTVDHLAWIKEGLVFGMPELSEKAIQAVAEVLYRDYDSEYGAEHLSWRDFVDQARKILVSVVPILAEPYIDLLRCFVDHDPCDFDHHGGCQAHGFLSLEPGERCPNAEVSEMLAALPERSDHA